MIGVSVDRKYVRLRILLEEFSTRVSAPDNSICTLISL